MDDSQFSGMKKLFTILLFIVAHFALIKKTSKAKDIDLDHAHHFGILEMSFDNEKEEFNCKIILFTNDLERVLRNRFDLGVIDIAGENELRDTDQYILTYLQEVLFFKHKEANLKFDYVRRDGDLDRQNVYITIPFSEFEQAMSLKVKCNIFKESIVEQQNMLNYKSIGGIASINFLSDKFYSLKLK